MIEGGKKKEEEKDEESELLSHRDFMMITISVDNSYHDKYMK